MSAERGPTRAQLMEQVADLEACNADLRDDRDAWRRARVADNEAEALSACVKALDALREQGRNRALGTTVAMFDFSDSRFRRILKYLADRYGVAWYEPPSDDALVTAAQAVVNEWDVRGDGGAMTSIQHQLREALGRRNR